jgi:hypothetical protein
MSPRELAARNLRIQRVVLLPVMSIVLPFSEFPMVLLRKALIVLSLRCRFSNPLASGANLGGYKLWSHMAEQPDPASSG